MQALQEKKPINTVVKFGNGNYCSLINDGSHFSYLVNTLNGDGLEEALENAHAHERWLGPENKMPFQHEMQQLLHKQGF